MFTRLFPIKIVISSRCGLLLSFAIALLANLPSLAIAFTLAGERAVKAISDPEKAADRIIRNTRSSNCDVTGFI